MTASGDEGELRSLALEHVRRHRRLKLRGAAFLAGMLVLVPVWLVVEYLNAGGWPQRLSNNGNTGDWNPWIIWIGLAWGFYVVLSALAIHFRRHTTEAEIERALDVLREARSQ